MMPGSLAELTPHFFHYLPAARPTACMAREREQERQQSADEEPSDDIRIIQLETTA